MAKYVFVVAFLLPAFLAQALQGNENECEVYTSENCMLGVRCKIKEESVEKRRSFTLTLVFSTGKEETVAEISYVIGSYKCETARDYTCGIENATIFYITMPCTARGELTLFDDEQAIPCMRAQRQRSSSELNPNIYKENDTDIQNDTSIISKEHTTAIAVSVCLIVMFIIIGICFIKRKVILKTIRNLQTKEKRDGAARALNSKNTTTKTTTNGNPLLEEV